MAPGTPEVASSERSVVREKLIATAKEESPRQSEFRQDYNSLNVAKFKFTTDQLRNAT